MGHQRPPVPDSQPGHRSDECMCDRGSWHTARRLSLALHGPTNHIHCLHWKCPTTPVHLSYAFLFLASIQWGTLYSSYRGDSPALSDRASRGLVEEHACPLKARFWFKHKRLQKMPIGGWGDVRMKLSVLWGWWTFQCVFDLILLCLY